MVKIGNPLTIPELNLMPEPEGGIELSKDMQQVLSLLTGFWRNKRTLLKSSPSGVLFTSSPQIKDIIHVNGVAVAFTYKGDDIECSEVLIMGHPDNVGTIWVKPHALALATNAWPLTKSEVVGLGITNLNMLNLLFANVTDTAIIAYTM